MPSKRRTVHIFGREYAVLLPTIRDPRLHVAAVLLTLQVLGQTVLGFRLSVAQILLCLATGALIEFVVAFFKDRALMWPASGLLTGNSAAIILRAPGTLHGQWWSLHSIWIFVAVVAISMASKYIIRWRGRHVFNPSNLGLVLAFVALGPRVTEPQDLWWIPIGPWLLVTYALLIGGGLLIGWELKLLGLELGFMAAFAAFTALALAAVPDHCMVASWHVAPLCGRDLWQILVASPEILVFALFMIPDPKTVPEGAVARLAFGILVALLSVLLLGPTTLEFWTKTAILASLVIACALRFALARFLAPLEATGQAERGSSPPALAPPRCPGARADVCRGHTRRGQSFDAQPGASCRPQRRVDANADPRGRGRARDRWLGLRYRCRGPAAIDERWTDVGIRPVVAFARHPNRDGRLERWLVRPVGHPECQ